MKVVETQIELFRLNEDRVPSKEELIAEGYVSEEQYAIYEQKSENNGTRGFSGFTLMESLLVLLVSSLFLFFPVVAIEYYQRSAGSFRLCARLEKDSIPCSNRPSSITHKLEQSIKQSQHQLFHFTALQLSPVTKIDVPPQLAMQAFPDILFSSQSGNNSSLRRIIFYWQEKKQTISYKFLFGSGRYEKSLNSGFILAESLIGFGSWQLVCYCF